MRGAPNHAAVANEQRLRCFVSYAQARRHRVRKLAVRLHGHDRVARIEPVFVEVIDQLIERFGARAARDTVLEEQERTLGCLGQQPIEIFDPLRANDIRMHLGVYAPAAALALYCAILSATVRCAMSMRPLKRAPSVMTT